MMSVAESLSAEEARIVVAFLQKMADAIGVLDEEHHKLSS